MYERGSKYPISPTWANSNILLAQLGPIGIICIYGSRRGWFGRPHQLAGTDTAVSIDFTVPRTYKYYSYIDFQPFCISLVAD